MLIYSKIFRFSLLAGAALFGCVTLSHSESINEKPNIVLIYVDDLGWKDLSCTGSPFYQTPHIDRLAEGGIRFTQAYAPAPLCAPSRGALVTGKFPGRTKFTSIQSNAPDDSLYSQSKALGIGNQVLEAPHRQNVPLTETLFAERFAEAGYATCFMGKWHCGRQPGYHPRDRGYDEFYSVRKAGGYPYYLTQEEIDNLENVPGAEVGDYLPENMTEWACEFMERQVEDGNPFLLHLSHFLVHTPITAKRGLVDAYEQRLQNLRSDQDNVAYATMVHALDDSVGRIVQKLSELGQLDNTLIVFTSDNGGYTGRETTSNYPLMGGKSFSYEGGYRVPLILYWPERIPGNQTSDERVIGMDLYPTFLEAANLPLDPQQHADGISLLGECTGGTPTSELESRALYFHHPHYTHASSPHSIIIEDDFKLIRYYNDATGGYALFDLENDPEEQINLAESRPELTARLAARLDLFLEETDSEMPIPAGSERGKRLIQLHEEGANKGYSPRFRDRTDVMNLETEKELALRERAVQEKKLQQGKPSETP